LLILTDFRPLCKKLGCSPLVVSGGQHSNKQQYSTAFTRWCYFRPVGFTDILVITDEGEWRVGGDKRDEGDEGNNPCPMSNLSTWLLFYS
ncbi:hypothetical protein, partial [uncultured Nostoc sp.]|uniref:hypothetical protein n=1 Tax=uncultured Nostoc sp. TaxID=340711 RepID=UPI00260ACB3E